jgi:hypothetical protein
MLTFKAPDQAVAGTKVGTQLHRRLGPGLLGNMALLRTRADCPRGMIEMEVGPIESAQHKVSARSVQLFW